MVECPERRGISKVHSLASARFVSGGSWLMIWVCEKVVRLADRLTRVSGGRY